MIPVPSNVRVWLATGHTDIRKGFSSLSLQVHEVLRRDQRWAPALLPRTQRQSSERIWHDGQGACLFTKRLERGAFCGRAQPTGESPAQLVEEAHLTFGGRSDGENRLRCAEGASSTSATAREMVRPARNSHGKGTTRMMPSAVADGLWSALLAGSSAVSTYTMVTIRPDLRTRLSSSQLPEATLSPLKYLLFKLITK